MKFLEPGQQIQTTIVAITNDCIFLDLNTKSEGVLDSTELLDKDGNITVKTGDTIKVFFMGEIHGEMKFTTKIKGENADATMLENAYKSQIPVEGHVEKEIKGGYEIKIGNSRAFCPYSQMGYKQKNEANTFVGKTLSFKIQEFKENGRNILVSNRVLLEEAHQNQIESLKETMKVGTIVKGKITALHDYGAFVDINGIQALLPISEISRSRVSDISAELSVGQEIQATILSTDWNKERISISTKSLLADPWDSIQDLFKVGTKYTGKISKVTEYGLFVELTPGIDGLVHISELTNIDRNTNLKKVYKAGQEISITIKEINQKDHRISLTTSVSNEQDITTEKYLNSQDDSDGETYNPFASLLKKK